MKDKVELGGCLSTGEARLWRWSERYKAVEELKQVETTYEETVKKAEYIEVRTAEEVTEERLVEQDEIEDDWREDTLGEEKVILAAFGAAKEGFTGGSVDDVDLISLQ